MLLGLRKDENSKMVDKHPDLEIIKFTVSLGEGKEDIVVPVNSMDEIIMAIPEHTEYQTTVHFFVRNNTIKNLHYKQEIKKGGWTVKTRRFEFGDEFEPREEAYSITFEKDITPGGFLFRALYPCVSTYYSGEEVLYEVPWVLEITAKPEEE